MRMYLVQHADAMSEDVNPERPLSAQGRREAQCVASLARRLGVRVREVRHSTKLRAQETAGLMGAALSPEDGVTQVEGLGPLDDVAPVARDLAAAEAPLMLVGHLPFMERLAAQMLVGAPEPSRVRFHQGGIVCLERTDAGWVVLWSVTPEIAGA